MGGGPLLQWSSTAIFAVVVVLCARDLLTRGDLAARLAAGLHVLMAAAMITMTWSWGSHIPVLVYVLVFTAAALYFAFLALYRDRHPHASPYHFLMMASMAVMAVVMYAPGNGALSTAQASGTGGMSHSMAGMSMGSGVGGDTPFWAVATSVVGATAYAVAFLVGFYLLVRSSGRTPDGGSTRPYAQVLMAAGMAVGFATMI
ncbi:DUF5134 domain-containing protein [Williamsia sp. CHRR-6]|uniref:DUF5134 domain-containing protein n=1 Tax=Williamsia sp. CHRR-6 TaxID=2835871 RepID=UPI001BD9A7DF|nr:DUF5134 domain-containing protein [Williamsia sp. CHRR-6]MBT0567842.1 DUF5134 domain-containing protein [Williamsia sp. CHRR-6]